MNCCAACQQNAGTGADNQCSAECVWAFATRMSPGVSVFIDKPRSLKQSFLPSIGKGKSITEGLRRVSQLKLLCTRSKPNHCVTGGVRNLCNCQNGSDFGGVTNIKNTAGPGWSPGSAVILRRWPAATGTKWGMYRSVDVSPSHFCQLFAACLRL